MQIKSNEEIYVIPTRGGRLLMHAQSDKIFCLRSFLLSNKPNFKANIIFVSRPRGLDNCYTSVPQKYIDCLSCQTLILSRNTAVILS